MRKSKSSLILIAVILGILFLIPMVWMVATSFKTDTEALSSMSLFPKHFTLDNYVYTLLGQGLDVPILRWLFNSLFVGICGSLLVVIIDAMVAYGLARLNVPFKKILFPMFISTLMIPWVITFIPLYLQFGNMGWLNTYLCVDLPVYGKCFWCISSVSVFQRIPQGVGRSHGD